MSGRGCQETAFPVFFCIIKRSRSETEVEIRDQETRRNRSKYRYLMLLDKVEREGI